MTIRFTDGTQIQIEHIYSRTDNIEEAMRDVLCFVIGAEDIAPKEIDDIFGNTENTDSIYDVGVDENGEETLSLVGEHYTLYLGYDNRLKPLPSFSDYYEPPQYHRPYIVELARQTQREIETKYIQAELEQTKTLLKDATTKLNK